MATSDRERLLPDSDQDAESSCAPTIDDELSGIAKQDYYEDETLIVAKGTLV